MRRDLLRDILLLRMAILSGLREKGTADRDANDGDPRVLQQPIEEQQKIPPELL